MNLKKLIVFITSLGGGIGRRSGFKIHRDLSHGSSSLPRGTNKNIMAYKWCPRRDLNPHTKTVLDPKSSASANSATRAYPTLHSLLHLQEAFCKKQDPINLKVQILLLSPHAQASLHP